MASINDVYNQLVAVNASLGQIHADGIAETNAATQVQASVDTLHTDVNAGFTATVNAVHLIAAIDVEVVKVLFHLTQQADTMICILEQVSRNTCELVTQSVLQTQLQTVIRDTTSAIRDVADSAYPAQALEQQRLAALRAAIERCCPAPEPIPACRYEPCPTPPRFEIPKLPTTEGRPKRAG